MCSVDSVFIEDLVGTHGGVVKDPLKASKRTRSRWTGLLRDKKVCFVPIVLHLFLQKRMCDELGWTIKRIKWRKLGEGSTERFRRVILALFSLICSDFFGSIV